MLKPATKIKNTLTALQGRDGLDPAFLSNLLCTSLCSNPDHFFFFPLTYQVYLYFRAFAVTSGFLPCLEQVLPGLHVPGSSLGNSSDVTQARMLTVTGRASNSHRMDNADAQPRSSCSECWLLRAHSCPLSLENDPQCSGAT